MLCMCADHVCAGTCLFGPSLADSPKGDLDSSGELDLPDMLVAVNDAVYPYGTSELFPDMTDSDHRIQSDSAHAYAECSNAGVCNRISGQCECYPGFAGVACQRMQCPGTPTCSGHGTCRSVRHLSHGQYRLWNRDMLQGCECDPGYYGGDCSMRKCRIGIDPLYLDDNGAIQFPFFFFAVMTTASTYDLSNGHPQAGPGRFTIKVYDQQGQAFHTQPISAPATCADMVSALEALPHRVIPLGSVVCFRNSFTEANALNRSSDAFSITYEGLYRRYLSGTRYNTIENLPAELNAGYSSSYTYPQLSDPLLLGDMYFMQFFGNPYTFGQPEIDIHLGDGTRASLISPGGVLVTKSWTNGQQGAGIDYFNHLCTGVNVRVKTVNGNTYLFGSFNVGSLLSCLGFADDNPDNDQEGISGIYDHGSVFTPFVARLVRRQQDYRDGGQLAVFFLDSGVKDFDTQGGFPAPYNPNGFAFRLLHPLRPLDDSEFNYYDIYASNSRVQMIQERSQAVFDFASNHIYTVNASAISTLGTADNEDYYDGDVSCKALKHRQAHGEVFDEYDSNTYCLNPGDLFFLLDPYNTSHNAPAVNMFQAQAIVTLNPGESYEFEDIIRGDHGVADKLWRRNLIVSDLNTNWAQAYGTNGSFHIYRFTPSAMRTYHYASECSNRGVCNAFEGLCDCFSGYAGDACQQQETILS